MLGIWVANAAGEPQFFIPANKLKRRVRRATSEDAAEIKSLIVRAALPYSYRPLENQAVVIAR